MGELYLAHLEQQQDDNARRTFGGPREQLEARADAQRELERSGRLDQAAGDVIRGMGINQSMPEETISIMASGWAVQHGFSSTEAQVISAKVLNRVRQPHLYGPMQLEVNTPQDKYSVRMQDLQQGSREALARRIAAVIGDSALAARVVKAICEGL